MSVFRVCFLGTPDFAATHLKALLDDSHYQVVGVVTQPDRPAGRSMKMTPSPVKQLAQAHGIEVLTPENLRKDPEVQQKIKYWKAEVAIVVAFGQILSEEFLNSFNFGAVNVHGSLLPKWRGAAPIQRSIQNGDRLTGVSLQKMVYKLDAGPVIGERKIELDDIINATELYKKMSELGCDLLSVELMDYLRGNLSPIPQKEDLVTLATKINKEESLLDWTKPATDLHNKVRAFSMGPGTYIFCGQKRMKIHRTKVIDLMAQTDLDSLIPVGGVLLCSDKELVIKTGKAALSLLEVQPESKNKMSISEFLKTNSFKKGDQLK